MNCWSWQRKRDRNVFTTDSCPGNPATEFGCIPPKPDVISQKKTKENITEVSVPWEEKCWDLLFCWFISILFKVCTAPPPHLEGERECFLCSETCRFTAVETQNQTQNKQAWSAASPTLLALFHLLRRFHKQSLRTGLSCSKWKRKPKLVTRVWLLTPADQFLQFASELVVNVCASSPNPQLFHQNWDNWTFFSWIIIWTLHYVVHSFSVAAPRRKEGN